MRQTLVFVATVATALLAIGVACSSDPTIVARTVPVDAGHCELGDASDGGDRCPSGMFCSRRSCNPNDTFCEAADASGCDTSGYECGCDGITYYNSCVRLEAHVSRAGPGQCSIGMPLIGCRPDEGCTPLHQGCGYIVPFEPPPPDAGSFNLPPPPDAAVSALQTYCENMPPFENGICWALPDPERCRSSSSSHLQSLCGKCIDDCAALESGRGPYFFACEPDASVFSH